MHRQLPADQAPEFLRTHPDIAFITGGRDCCAHMIDRLLDVAAGLIDRERAAIRAAERGLVEREEALLRAHEARAMDDGLPEDICAALEDAIRACGRSRHVEARKRLGDRLYDAIRALGHGCGWSWLCQQPAASMPAIARRVEARLGRVNLPPKPYVDRKGGGTHFRRTTPEPKRPVAPEKLADLLLPSIRHLGLRVPLEELRDLRITAADWNALLGRIVKKTQMGFVRPNAFGAYFLAAARRWEADHPIKNT